jgi:hypothetical protein
VSDPAIQTDANPAQKYFALDGTALTLSMAQVLIAHANGPRPIRALVREMQMLRALRARKLIQFNRSARPTHTTATQRGRELIVALLAAQAEVLTSRAVDR